MIDLNAIKNLNIKLKFGKAGKNGQGVEGGQGGNIKIISNKNKFKGKVSAKGGRGKR